MLRENMHVSNVSLIPSKPRCSAERGFSLVEMLIAMVVLAILAAIAVPTYNESVRKSRRSEAFTALATLQQAQERWRNNQAAYASSVTASPTDDPPGLGLSDETPGGYYTVSIDAANATGYTATAYGKDDTSQAQDTACRALRVRMTGGNLTYAGCTAADCDAFAPTNPCWAR